LTLYCNLLMKKTQSAVYTSKAAKWTVENFVVFAFSINIEYTNDKNEVAIVDFEFYNLVVSIEGNRLNWKREKLFSDKNVMLIQLKSEL